MKYLSGESYVEVKHHRYKIQPTENIILRERDPPTSLRTQYQIQNETQIRKNQKVDENNGKTEVRNYPKNKQTVVQQQQISNHQIVLVAKEVTGQNLIKATTAEIVTLLLTNKNMKLIKKSSQTR